MHTNTKEFFQAYESFCAKTAIYPQEVEVEYLALGLASEAGEVLDKLLRNNLPVSSAYAELRSETGDCAWYIARLFNAIGQSFADSALVLCNEAIDSPPRLIVSAMELSAAAGVLAGAVKKQIRDGKHWNGEQRENHRTRMAALLISTLSALLRLNYAINLTVLVNTAGGNEYTLADLLSANMDKLTSRQQRNVLGGDGDHR